MDTEYGARLVAELLALKDAPDDALLDQVRAIGVTATRYMLFDVADRLQHSDQRTATDEIPWAVHLGGGGFWDSNRCDSRVHTSSLDFGQAWRYAVGIYEGRACLNALG